MFMCNQGTRCTHARIAYLGISDKRRLFLNPFLAFFCNFAAIPPLLVQPLEAVAALLHPLERLFLVNKPSRFIHKHHNYPAPLKTTTLGVQNHRGEDRTAQIINERVRMDSLSRFARFMRVKTTLKSYTT